MNKQTKLILGLGALAVIGYLLWDKSKKPKPVPFLGNGRKKRQGRF